MNSRTRALVEIVILYLLTAAAGVLTYASTTGDEIVRFLLADLVMTAVVFVMSVAKRNTSAYDAFWSVIPFCFIVGLWLLYGDTTWSSSAWAVAAVVGAWSWRLTFNWARGWTGWHHEDWRYVMFRERMGRNFVWINVFGLHLYPTLAVFLACVPLFWIAQPTQEIVWLMAMGVGISWLGVWFEFQADNELADFRNRAGRNPEDLLDTGLWARCRNPNYLGEMLFWIGLAVCGVAAGGPWYVASGALGMVVLFITASIPMKEQRMLARRPSFSDYVQRVPMVLPLGRPAAHTQDAP